MVVHTWWDIPWIKHFLTAKYYDRCLNHSPHGPVCNNFCSECQDFTPFCSSCNEDYHQGHHVLQVRKASHQVAICLNDIKGFVDSEDIKIYSVNGKKILFLCSRQTKGCMGRGRHGCCRTCDWKLDDEGLYCSIHCKLVAEESKPSQKEEPVPQASKRPYIPSVSNECNFRKKSRKSLPHRSPFF